METETSNSTRVLVSPEFIRSTGLLYFINRHILHPLGYALDTFTIPEVELGIKDLELLEFIEYKNPAEAVFTEEEMALGEIKYQRFIKSQGAERADKRKQVTGFATQPLVQFGATEPYLHTPSITTTTTSPLPVTQSPETTTQIETPLTSAKLGAAVRKDLVSETPSFSSRVKEADISGDNGNIDLPEEDDSPKVDISKYKVINKTAFTSGCKHPHENIISSSLGSGGSIVFCTLCGTQFKDGDLVE